jgi:hypothetical protein
MQIYKTPKVVRWKCAIQEFDFDVEHVAGVDNQCADAFSRLIDECSDEEVEVIEEGCNMKRMVMMLEEVVIPQDKLDVIKEFHGMGHGHFGVDMANEEHEEEGVLE